MFDLILNILYYFHQGDDTRFTKEEIDELVKKHIKDTRGNELSDILLYKTGYLSEEVFNKRYGIEVISGKTYFLFDGFDDILNVKDDKFYISILEGEIWEVWQSYDFYETDIDWGNYTKKTLEYIMKYCIENEVEFGETSDNIHKCNKDNIKLIDVKRWNKTVKEIEIDGVKLSEISDDDLDDNLIELKKAMQRAIADAQEVADQDEAYNKTIRAFKNSIGDYTHINKPCKIWDKEKNKQKDSVKEMLAVNLNVSWDDVMDNMIKWTCQKSDTYLTYIDFEENLESMITFFKNMDLMNFNKPDLDNLYGSIDNGYLNELTVERIVEI